MKDQKNWDLGKIFTNKVTITLSEKEMNEVYQKQKRLLDINEIKEVMHELEIGEILRFCHYPYPSHHYFQNEKIEEAEEYLLEQEDLMLAIYDKFEEYQLSHHSVSQENMLDAAKRVLQHFGEEHPDFLEAYETIDVIAYKKYQKDWIECQDFSEEYLNEIKERYKKYKEQYYPISCYSFHEYIDQFGFDGMCYTGIDEFINAEYQDSVYMNSLLTEEEYEKYLNNVSLYVWKDIVLVQGSLSVEKFPISGEISDQYYQADDFLKAVSKKLGVATNKIKTYIMNGITFDSKEISFDPEECGCYIKGILQLTPERKESLVKNEIKEIKDMVYDLPYGGFRDADAVLVRIMDSVGLRSAGFTDNIFEIWDSSSDKKSVERLFKEFTHCEFLEFLKKSKDTLYSVKLTYEVHCWLYDKINYRGACEIYVLMDSFEKILANWSPEAIKADKAHFFSDLIDVTNNYFSKIGIDAIIEKKDFDYLLNQFAEILKIRR